MASSSTVRAGTYSASITTGERPSAVTMMSGRRPGLPAMARVFSDHTCLPGIIPLSKSPRALFAFGSVWRGILFRDLFEPQSSGGGDLQRVSHCQMRQSSTPAHPQGLSKVLERYEKIDKGGERWMSHRLCLRSLEFSGSS